MSKTKKDKLTKSYRNLLNNSASAIDRISMMQNAELQSRTPTPEEEMEKAIKKDCNCGRMGSDEETILREEGRWCFGQYYIIRCALCKKISGGFSMHYPIYPFVEPGSLWISYSRSPWHEVEPDSKEYAKDGHKTMIKLLEKLVKYYKKQRKTTLIDEGGGLAWIMLCKAAESYKEINESNQARDKAKKEKKNVD